MKLVRYTLGLALAAAVTAAFSMPAPAQANTTIDTTPSWDGTNLIQPLGEPNTATYGQTFTAPADSVLNDFTFYLEPLPYPGADLSEGTTLKGYVMAWDGSKATGPILYQSGTVTTPPPGGGFAPYAFNTGGTVLTPGAQYVAFLSASGLFDSDEELSGMGWIDHNVYNGGAFVYYNNGNNFSLLTSHQWDATNGFFGTGDDTAFKADFSPVPEPNSLALLATGGLPFLGFLRRRRLA